MAHPFRSATLVVALSCLAGANPVAAQLRVASAERGWVGVSVELLTTVVRGRGTSVVTVTEVSEGSPAERAGIRPGDVLVSMNGRGGNDLISLGVGPVPEELAIRPGDPVRIVLERDGSRREVTLEAGHRPERLHVTTTWSFRVSRDSVADRMFRAMDSLKVRLFSDPGRTVAVVGDSPRRDARVEVVGRPVVVGESPTGLPRWEPYRLPGPVALPELQAPFALLVLAGPERDSLRFELERLNREIREVSNLQALRLRRLDSDGGRAAGDDRELRRIEGTLTALRERSVELQASIERAASLELYGSGRTTPETSDVMEEAVFRPLAPYVLGQRRAAGAEVVELRPELADYFGVRGGVLVVDVAEGTPASLAGMLPGDVLTNVNGMTVGSIAELRAGLARADPDAVVDVVRKGRTLRLRLSR
jgi:membrane-associated protease RseP (regulator of RpoE activity)